MRSRPSPVRTRVVAGVAVLSAILTGCGASSARHGCPLRVASDGQRPFAPTAVWNSPVLAGAQVDPSSSQLVAQLNAEVEHELAVHVGPWINIGQYSVPVYTVPGCEPTVSVHLDNGNDPSLEQALAKVPVPRDAQPAGGTDQTMVVLQPSTNRMWEFWEMHRQDGGWHASWGGLMNDVSRDPGYFQGPGPSRSWGASASGLSVLGGLITPQDVSSGSINHALAMALPIVRSGQFARPAERTDGRVPPPQGIPEGAHLRLDPTLNLSTLHLSPLELEIATAAQRYGIIVRDYSTTVALFGEDPRGLGYDPWPQMLGNALSSPNTLWANFPWDRLQVLRMDLASN
jgi:hypothetical protein